MAQFSRMAVLNTILDLGLIPLFYEKDPDIAVKIVRACIEGGARCIEYTNRGDGAHLVFGELGRCFGEDKRLVLGVGSVIDSATAALYMQLGANFVVGPTLSDEVAFTCNRRKIAYLPGCGSVNDISHAEMLGVEICKLFPADCLGGTNFLKTIRGPMPWSLLMPTGGVLATQESIQSWILAGAACVGIGSQLIRKEDVASGNYANITEKVRSVLDWIKFAREQLLVQPSAV